MLVTLVFAMQAAGLIVGPLLAAALLIRLILRMTSSGAFWSLLAHCPPSLFMVDTRHLKSHRVFSKLRAMKRTTPATLQEGRNTLIKRRTRSLLGPAFPRLVDSRMILIRSSAQVPQVSDGLCLLLATLSQPARTLGPMAADPYGFRQKDADPNSGIFTDVRGARLCYRALTDG